MGKVLRVASITVLALAISSTAAAASTTPLPRKAPFWMQSAKIRHRISAAGTRGVSMTTIRRWVAAGAAGRKNKEEPTPDPCPGLQPSAPPPALQAGACETYPYGCTANFIFHDGPGFTGTSDGQRDYIGTAGHCTDHANQPVFMTINEGATVAKIGTVYKRMNGGLGNDFTAVRILPGFHVDPRSPVGGPHGIYTGCGADIVRNFGHGYGVAVAQGKPEGGLATNWFDRSYGWTGVAIFGDSGSGVVKSNGESAGDLTHLLIDSRYPGSDVAGTRTTRIMDFLPATFYQVNDDGSESRATMADTKCGNANNGSGSGAGPLAGLPLPGG